MRLPWFLVNPTLRIILFLAVLAGVGVGLVLPFMTLTARDRGVSLGAIGVMASSYLLAQVVLQLPSGMVSDRIGRRVPVALGLLIEALATSGFAFADSAAEFIALRVGQGIGISLLYPSLRALVADSTPAERRGQAFAVVAAAFSGGLLFGPPIGGALADRMGISTLFLLAAVLQTAIAGWTLFALRAHGRPVVTREQSAAIPFRRLFSLPLAGAFIFGFAGQFQIGLFSGIWSIYLNDLGASDVELGLSFSLFSVAFMLFAPIGGRIADRSQRWLLLLGSHLIYAVIVAIYGVAGSVESILLLSVFEGLIVAAAQPAVDAYLASVTDPRIQGRVQGAFATFGMSGAAISAFLGSVLYGISPAIPFFTGGVVLILLTLVATTIVRRVETGTTARHPELGGLDGADSRAAGKGEPTSGAGETTTGVEVPAGRP